MVETRQPTLTRSTYAVWELTLRCNLKCIHCGSRAGDARHDELTTEEALDLVRQMAEIGVKEVSVIGGEAFLRKDWLEICREIVKHDITLTMVTGGFGLGPKMAAQMADVGFDRISVSVDGLQETHDHLRGRPGSFEQCFQALAALREVGIPIYANTQINRMSAPELPRIYQRLLDAGVKAWQVQMTVPMGNAADNNHLLLQPPELHDVFPVLAYLYERGAYEGLRMAPGNNVGYFGPFERMFRTRVKDDEAQFWIGSTGGVLTLGIESDGTIKADPSLPTDDYAGGNIREKSLKEIVYEADELTLNDERSLDHMWGFCKTCEFAPICRAGDLWTAHVYFDRPGNNPLCHHRSLFHKATGQRERAVIREKAEGVPFDNGVFEMVVEPDDAPWPEDAPPRFRVDDVDWPEEWVDKKRDFRALFHRQMDRMVEVWAETRVPAATASSSA